MSDAVDLTASESEMLDLLDRALASPTVEPSDESRRVLRQAVASLAPPRPNWRQRMARQRRKPWVMVGAFFGIAVIGTGSAFAAGAPLPAPIREAASALHLPVTPLSVVDEHQAQATLRQSLVAPTPDPRATARAAQVLNTQYQALDHTQQAQVRATTPGLPAEACARLGLAIGSDHTMQVGLDALWPGCRGHQGGVGTTSVNAGSATGAPASTVGGPGPATHGTSPWPENGDGTGTPGRPSTTGGTHGGPPVTGSPSDTGGGGGPDGAGGGGGGADGWQGRTGSRGRVPHDPSGTHTPDATHTGSKGENPGSDGPLRRGQSAVHR